MLTCHSLVISQKWIRDFSFKCLFYLQSCAVSVGEDVYVHVSQGPLKAGGIKTPLELALWKIELPDVGAMNQTQSSTSAASILSH